MLCPSIDEELFLVSYLDKKGFYLYFVTMIVTL